jgi:hypothetical protein
MNHIVRKTTDPASAPSEAGIHWINTTTGNEFFSVGTSTVNDWIPRENYVPAGGTTGQVLKKTSGTDYDVEWANEAGGGGTWGSITGTLSNQTDLQNALDAKQNSLGFTAENVANKDNGALSSSTTTYPTSGAVKTYADAKVADAINNGTTDVAPSQNAVFDALALKANLSGAAFTGAVSSTGEITAFKGTNKEIGMGEHLIDIAGTAVEEGGTLSINANPAKYDISDGTGIIVDHVGDTFKQVTWSGLSAITPSLTGTVYVYIEDPNNDNVGTVYETNTAPTPSSLRSRIFLGEVIVSGGNVIRVDDYPVIDQAISNQFYDLGNAVGVVNITGNRLSANGTNLSLNKSAGTLFVLGVNFHADPTNPHYTSISSGTAFTFQHMTQTAETGSNVTVISPSNYDNAGTVTAIAGSANQATNMRVYLFPNGDIRVAYGQVIYTTLAAAVAGISTSTFVTNPRVTAEKGIMIGVLSVTKGCTALNDSATAVFTPVSKFGESLGGASGGTSTTTMQQAYDNSTSPEILTNSTIGALTIRRGSAADTDNVLEILNNASTITAYIKGDGSAQIDGVVFGTNSSAPNATIPVVGLTATNAATNVDMAILPKGTGAILADTPDSASTGGNKRGTNAIDLQIDRSAAGQVASGNYSAISGGSRNTASNTYSFAMGFGNTASGASSVAIGNGNTASASQAVAMGLSNAASGVSSVALGSSNTASGAGSVAMGLDANTFSITGRMAHGSTSFSTNGDAQSGRFRVMRATTDATPTEMTASGAAPSTNIRMVLQNNNTIGFTGLITAKQSGSTNAACWKVEGMITRGASAAATTLVTSTVTAISNAPAWTTPAFSADTTNGALILTVTGVAATNIRWSARVDTEEVIYA